MKKKILLIIALVVLLTPINSLAATKEIEGEKYTYMNFEESLADEEIKYKDSDYNEKDNQAIIYLFRGKGCSFCRSFLEYLNSIVDDYGNYFKVVSFEVWYDAKNANLMNDVSEFLGEQAGGVPYIIIGNQVFPGYTESYNDAIEKAIKDLYDSKDRYDVFEEFVKRDTSQDTDNSLEGEASSNEGTVNDENYSASSSSSSDAAIIIWNLVFIIAGITTVMIYIYVNDKKLNKRLDEIEKKITVLKKDKK